MKWLCDVLRAPLVEASIGVYDPMAQVNVVFVDGARVPAVDCLDRLNLLLTTKTAMKPGDVDSEPFGAAILATKTLWRDVEHVN